MTSATRLDYYFQLIDNLTDNDKLELIARISTSLKQYKRKNTKSSPTQSLFGALDDDETAEAWIARIREHNDMIMVTNNSAHLGRINNIIIEDWKI